MGLELDDFVIHRLPANLPSAGRGIEPSAERRAAPWRTRAPGKGGRSIARISRKSTPKAAVKQHQKQHQKQRQKQHQKQRRPSFGFTGPSTPARLPSRRSQGFHPAHSGGATSTTIVQPNNVPRLRTDRTSVSLEGLSAATGSPRCLAAGTVSGRAPTPGRRLAAVRGRPGRQSQGHIWHASAPCREPAQQGSKPGSKPAQKAGNFLAQKTASPVPGCFWICPRVG